MHRSRPAVPLLAGDEICHSLYTALHYRRSERMVVSQSGTRRHFAWHSLDSCMRMCVAMPNLHAAILAVLLEG